MNNNKDTAKRIKQGDMEAYEALFRSLYPNLCRYAQSLLHDKDQAEEVVQEMFYRLWRDRSKINIKSSLKSYLYRSVYNNSLQMLRHEQVKEKYHQSMKEQEAVYAPDPMDEYRYKQMERQIAKTMESLPVRCREIFYMNRFEGQKYKEIAEKLSISVKTVEANMSKALREFRKVVAQLETEK
jgi:RNA polymerase sigma-70 factor (ECF subfamily)